MAAAEGAPVEGKGKGAASPEEEAREAAASEERKEAAAAEAKGVHGVKMITLRSEDGEERSMPAVAAKLSGFLSNMIDGDCVDGVIPIELCATGRTLDTVIEYCVKHAAEPVVNDDSDDPSGAEDLEKWDRKLADGLSVDYLYDLLIAANYLSIPGLLRVFCQRAADMINGKTTQQIRDIFNLTYDLTPADEAELFRQYPWIFER